jgi:hypothetical protein
MFKRFSFFLLILGNSALGQGIQVSPVKLFFNLNPNESKTQLVGVTNQSDKSKLFEVSLSDWYRDSLGDKIYASPGSLPSSCSEWISIRPSVLELKANEKKDIEVQMNRPASGNSDFNKAKSSMLFIKEIKEKESIQDPKIRMESRMIIEYRLGVHIYQSPLNNTLTNVDIDQLKFLSSEKNPKDWGDIILKLNNNGSQISESVIKIILTNNINGDEVQLGPANISMMPETKRIVKINIPRSVPSGNYSVVTIVDSGVEYELKIAELEINL